MHRARPTHALGALAVTASALALATGCSATNPATTQLQYDPADGQDVVLGAVDVDGLMVISKSSTDGPGALVARLSNTSDTATTITMSGAGGADLQEKTFDVPAHGATKIGPDQEQSATLPTVGAQPGGLIHLTVSSEGGKSRKVAVPVLSGAQPEFASLVPTPTPTPTSTFVATPSPTTSSSQGPPMISRPSGRSTSTSVRPVAPASTQPVTEAAPTPTTASSPTPSRSTLTLASSSSPSPSTTATS